jgi:hypothetical protein
LKDLVRANLSTLIQSFMEVRIFFWRISISVTVFVPISSLMENVEAPRNKLWEIFGC